MMSIHSVKLYKLNNVQWVFDDPSKGILAEAFVGGADELIDACFEQNGWKYNNQMNYTLQFSTKDFPGATHLEFLPLQSVPEYPSQPGMVDSGSYWICYNIDERVIWLCDTLDEYIEEGDTLLFFNIKASKRPLTLEEQVRDKLERLI